MFFVLTKAIIKGCPSVCLNQEKFFQILHHLEIQIVFLQKINMCLFCLLTLIDFIVVYKDDF